MKSLNFKNYLYQSSNMKNLLRITATTALLFSTPTAAVAGDYNLRNYEGGIYGPLTTNTTVSVCNNALNTLATFYTDETRIEHALSYSADIYCEVIKSKHSYVKVSYDNSFAHGDQLTTVYLKDGESLSLETGNYYGDITHTVISDNRNHLGL